MRFFDNRPMVAFMVLCLIWGTTWLAVKVAIAEVPPLLLGGTRFTVAGFLMTVMSWPKGQGFPIKRADLGRLFASALLMISLCYGPLFWGMQYIESGVAAVIEEALTPVALLICAVILREEVLTIRKVAALSLGLVGIGVMFLPDLLRTTAPGSDDDLRFVGGLAVAASAFTYALGSVLARPLLRAYPATLLAGFTTLLGGGVLLAGAFLFEPEALGALDFQWGWQAWAGWLYLTVFGSLVAYVLYMQLLRDLGPSKSSNYAFVAPAIALLVGAVALGESVSWVSSIGMGVMLVAAFLSLHGSDNHAKPTVNDRP